MNKRIIITALTGLFAILVSTYSCTKLDTTTLGTDVIPVVDNINTFADTLNIVSTQGIFNDTSTISSTDDHALGLITNDELFGQTDASIYFQLKPRFYPYYYGQANDTVIGIDSIVLALKYRGFYGDSTIPQTLQVSEVSQSANGLWDSIYQPRPVNFVVPTASVLGTKTVDIRNLKNQVKFGNNKDSATYQIRIKLDDPTWLSDRKSHV